MKNFRELYCERYGISAEQFEHAVVARTLHPHAKLVYWLLGLNREYTSPDYEFVRSVGELRSRREFRNEAAEYHYHPRNVGLLRRGLRLRVSSHRLQMVFEELVASSQTRAPFQA